MRLRCPECDYPRAVEVKELWEYESDGKSVRVSDNPAGYCVLCPRCDCRYEMTPEGAHHIFLSPGLSILFVIITSSQD